MYNIKNGGAMFGLCTRLLQLAAFRPPTRTGIKSLDTPSVSGLHFMSASTRPGNGVLSLDGSKSGVRSNLQTTRKHVFEYELNYYEIHCIFIFTTLHVHLA